MSACISREGEYSDHTEGDEAFVCGRCGVEDWTAAMAEMATLTEQRDRAERRYERLESAVEALADEWEADDQASLDTFGQHQYATTLQLAGMLRDTLADRIAP